MTHPFVSRTPRDLITLHIAMVERVHRGVATAGGRADQWTADLKLLPGGVEWSSVKVLGDRTPVTPAEGRPSYALCGVFGGNMADPWCIPIPWMSAPPALLPGSELLEQYDSASIRLSTEGVYSIGGDEPWIRLSAAAALLRDGSRRMARGGDADTYGDLIAINAESSPAFAAWAANITEVVNLILLFANGLGMPPVVVPPAPATLPLTPGGALLRPNDTVPAVDDQPARGSAGVQVVGEIVTGSATVRGQ